MREKEAGTDNKKRMLTTEKKEEKNKNKTMEINGVLRDFILCIEIIFVKFIMMTIKCLYRSTCKIFNNI